MNKQCKIYKNGEINYSRDPIDKKKLINGYKVIKIIGEGAFGKIKLAIKNNEEYAIKKFNKFILRKKNKIYKNPNGSIYILKKATKYVSFLEEVYREIDIHQQLDHPNIIKLIEIIDDDEKDKLYVILEYAEKGQILKWESQKLLFSLNWKFDEITFKHYAQQMLQALSYLQQNYIAHRDIKPHNILIDKNDIIKICDFGCAQQLSKENDRVKGTEGTFQFVAPECLRENKKSDIPGYNGHLADIWSLGVVFYCIVDQRLPFYSDIMLDLFKQIETKEIKLKYDGPAKNLILQMLNRDTNLRPTAFNLLNDPYFK